MLGERKEEGLHMYVGVSDDRSLYNKPYTLDAQEKNRFRKKVVSPMPRGPGHLYALVCNKVCRNDAQCVSLPPGQLH